MDVNSKVITGDSFDEPVTISNGEYLFSLIKSVLYYY